MAEHQKMQVDGSVMTYYDRYIKRWIHTKDDLIRFSLINYHLHGKIANRAVRVYHAMLYNDVAEMLDVINEVGSAGFIFEECNIHSASLSYTYRLPFIIGKDCFECLLQVVKQEHYPMGSLVGIISSQINHGVDVTALLKHYFPTWPYLCNMLNYQEVVKKSMKDGKGCYDTPHHHNLIDLDDDDRYFVPAGSEWAKKFIEADYPWLTLSDMMMIMSRRHLSFDEKINFFNTDNHEGSIHTIDTDLEYIDDFMDVLLNCIFAHQFGMNMIMPSTLAAPIPMDYMMATIVASKVPRLSPTLYPAVLSLITLPGGVTLTEGVQIISDVMDASMIVSIFDHACDMPKNYTDVIVTIADDESQTFESHVPPPPEGRIEKKTIRKEDKIETVTRTSTETKRIVRTTVTITTTITTTINEKNPNVYTTKLIESLGTYVNVLNHRS